MRYILLVFLGACSYGILSTIVKLAYGQGYSPAEVIGGQMFFGLVLTLLPSCFSCAKAAQRPMAPPRCSRFNRWIDGNLLLQCSPIHPSLHRNRLAFSIHMDGGIRRGHPESPTTRQTNHGLANYSADRNFARRRYFREWRDRGIQSDRCMLGSSFSGFLYAVSAF